MVCDFLPQLCDDSALRPGKANNFYKMLTDDYSRIVAVDHLLTGHPPRVIPKLLEALQVSLDPVTPQDARVSFLKALSHSQTSQRSLLEASQETLLRALIRSGVREMCLLRLQQPDLTKDEEEWVANLCGSAMFDEEEGLEKMITEVCWSLGRNDAEPGGRAAAARTLAILALRRQHPCSTSPVQNICYHGTSLACLTKTEGCLHVLVDAMSDVARPVAADIAVVLSAIAT